MLNPVVCCICRKRSHFLIIAFLLFIAVSACYRARFILRLVQRDKLALAEFAEFLGRELQVAARDPVGKRSSSATKVLSMGIVYLNSRCKDDVGFVLSTDTLAAVSRLAEGRVIFPFTCTAPLPDI